MGGCTGGLQEEVTATVDVQSGSRLAADEVLVATVAGDAVDFTGLKALQTMEFDTLSKLEDSSATVLLY